MCFRGQSTGEWEGDEKIHPKVKISVDRYRFPVVEWNYMKENHWLAQLPRVNQLSLNLCHDERWLHKLPSSLKYLCSYFPFYQAIVSIHSILKNSNPPFMLTMKTCNFKTITNNDPPIFSSRIIKIIAINTNQLSSAIFICIIRKLIPSVAQLLSLRRPAWKS